ncbi:hypothetical protein [Arthrobacter monumenti]
MFTIDTLEVDDPIFGDRRVVDHERHIRMQMVAGHVHRPGESFKLVVGEAVIPFEASEELVEDPEPGESFLLRRFETFGTSPTAASYAGIQPYRFKDEAAKRQMMRIAAEALLIYGYFYDGDQQPDGFIRVELDGEMLTRGSAS